MWDLIAFANGRGKRKLRSSKTDVRNYGKKAKINLQDSAQDLLAPLFAAEPQLREIHQGRQQYFATRMAGN